MKTKQSISLDRKKLLADPVMITAIIGIFVFLLLFIVYPLSILLVDSVYVDKKITLSVFFRIFAMAGFRRAITNTLFLGMVTGIGGTLIGFIFAYVDTYVDVGSRLIKKLFNLVSILPVVSPPFVLSLSAILMFGRTGLITRGIFDLSTSALYGLPGIALVQILTFFPVCYLMLKGLLKNIDPSLEDAVRSMGASRFKVFTTVTFPLLLPGLGNAFLITFIESVADFANPMIIGGNYDTLATSIYLQLTGAYDKSGATAMAVVLLTVSMGLFILEKYW
ncbi:MAG TPA: ABC transporter permease subunit, partial [Treponemataceae bacterium]|nr:ABC transporter permease subunit [Treponemataceae bacterium]